MRIVSVVGGIAFTIDRLCSISLCITGVAFTRPVSIGDFSDITSGVIGIAGIVPKWISESLEFIEGRTIAQGQVVEWFGDIDDIPFGVVLVARSQAAWSGNGRFSENAINPLDRITTMVNPCSIT